MNSSKTLEIFQYREYAIRTQVRRDIPLENGDEQYYAWWQIKAPSQAEYSDLRPAPFPVVTLSNAHELAKRMAEEEIDRMEYAASKGKA